MLQEIGRPQRLILANLGEDLVQAFVDAIHEKSADINQERISSSGYGYRVGLEMLRKK
jgi:hypothetical protein